jgi:integrase
VESLRKSELERIKVRYGFNESNVANSTNKSLVNTYLSKEYSKRKNLKERTKEQIKYEFHAVLKILGPDVSLLKDDRDTIYYQILGDMNYSDGSKRRLICRFNALLKYAGRDFKIPKIQVQKSKKIPHITESELDMFLNHLGHKVDKLAAEIIFHTGLRSGELFGLEEADVNFKSRFLSVERQLTRDLIIQKPKNNKDRDILIPTKLKKTLREWLKLPESEKREQRGRLSHRFLRASRAIWGKDKAREIGPHDLRRSFAIHMLGRGFSITQISFLLGDSEQVVRAYYAGYSANKEMLEQMKEKLG